MLGVHLNGSTISCKDADDTTVGFERECASGGGAGGAVGIGITKWLMVYAGGTAAKVKIKGVSGVNDSNGQPGHTLIHADIGARFSVPS